MIEDTRDFSWALVGIIAYSVFMCIIFWDAPFCMGVGCA